MKSPNQVHILHKTQATSQKEITIFLMAQYAGGATDTIVTNTRFLCRLNQHKLGSLQTTQLTAILNAEPAQWRNAQRINRLS